MESLLSKAKDMQESLVEHRRYLHANAEVGMHLPVTTEYVMTQLKAMGYEPEEVCQSGVVAIAGKKKEGKTFLLRADMDALPMREQADVPYKSTNGNMHACGHDFHASMLLGAAKLLKDHEDKIDGQVKLMFQPAEEIFSGAKAMVEAGILENPRVDAAMMIHVASGVQGRTGTVVSPASGVGSSSSDTFKITVQGKGTHGAMPQMGVDPLSVTSHIHLALQNINARETAATEPTVVTVGQIHGGAASNIIPDTAFMEGTIRSLSSENRDFVKSRVSEIAKSIGATFRAEVTTEFINGCPSTYNNSSVLNEIKGYIKELVGIEHFFDASTVKELKNMGGSEDFAFVTSEVPSAMLALFAGSTADGHTYPLHHPQVTFDEDALSVGAAVYAQAAIKWLESNK